MTVTLIEVVCPLSQQSAQTTLEQYFKQTGDLLISRRIYPLVDAVLLVIRLLDPANVSKHRMFLDQALQGGLISSYEYVTCDLVTASLDSPPDICDQMRDFPLRPGESWFPAIDDPHQAYICLDTPWMTSEQIAWLLEHQVKWTYV